MGGFKATAIQDSKKKIKINKNKIKKDSKKKRRKKENNQKERKKGGGGGRRGGVGREKKERRKKEKKKKRRKKKRTLSTALFLYGTYMGPQRRITPSLSDLGNGTHVMEVFRAKLGQQNYLVASMRQGCSWLFLSSGTAERNRIKDTGFMQLLMQRAALVQWRGFRGIVSWLLGTGIIIPSEWNDVFACWSCPVCVERGSRWTRLWTDLPRLGMGLLL